LRGEYFEGFDYIFLSYAKSSIRSLNCPGLILPKHSAISPQCGFFNFVPKWQKLCGFYIGTESIYIKLV
jgi:hypothetical protein